MKTFIRILAAGTALLALSASSLLAAPMAWSQLGFTVELSEGQLAVGPAGSFTDSTAGWHDPSVPLHASHVASTTDGYAMATAGSSNGISIAVQADNFFLLDAMATTELVQGASGYATATALAFFDLTFTGVLGPTVTLTLTPIFYESVVPGSGAFGYVSAFLSLGGETFVSYRDTTDSSGYAAFAPITVTVASDATVQLNSSASAGVQVPDTGSSTVLLSVGLLGLAGFRCFFTRRAI